MRVRAVLRRCQQVLRTIDLPDPFDLESCARIVGARRGRPIRLVPENTPLGPCGLCLALPDTDVVFYEDTTTVVHRDHVIVHELAHLLCGQEPDQELDPHTLAALLPRLDPTMVRSVLGRSAYTDAEEQEAEVMASLVLERRERPPARSPTPCDSGTPDTCRTSASSRSVTPSWHSSPFMDGSVATEAARAALRQGADPQDARAAGDAAALATALAAHAESQPTTAPRRTPHGGTTLAEETAWLKTVARHFRRCA